MKRGVTIGVGRIFDVSVSCDCFVNKDCCEILASK